MSIQTDSTPIEEPKDPESCSVFSLYKLFASKKKQEELKLRYTSGGMGWGEAKQELFETMEKIIAPKRLIYDELMEDKQKIDTILAEGAEKAREIASKKIKDLRKVIVID